MRQTQRETNNAQSRKIEQLIERKKSGEQSKQNVEKYLIFGILAFCLTLLVVVITGSNGDSNVTSDKANKNGEPKNTEGKTKEKPLIKAVNK
jgi:hypothetical protein